jgi:hypothetical protein
MFVDGVQEGGDVAISGAVNDSAIDFVIGEIFGGGGGWHGWLDEFGLWVGRALHSENFTPPTLPYDQYAWTELVQEVQLADDAPVLFRFEPQVLTLVALKLQPAATIPRAAVLYAGPLTILQRGIYVGHTPITDGLVTETVNNRSISGHYLGTTVLSRHNMTAVALANLTPAWYRTYLRPFIAARVPFFFAWKPETYPYEIGYGWFPDGHNPKPSNQRNNGMMQVSWQMEGVT